MPSYAQRRRFTCACGATAEADIWLIVDTTELPHAIEQLRLGTLHQTTCPQCAGPVEIDAPVLLYRPGGDPPLIFLPAKQTSAEDDKRDLQGLTVRLRNRLGKRWRDSWIRPLNTVSQEMARFVFSEEARDWHAMEVGEITRTASAFTQCATWSDARAMVDQHPKLLSPLADKFLEQLAKDQVSAAAAARVESARAFLQVCRSRGAEWALAEKLDAGEDRIEMYSARLVEALKAFTAPPTWEEAQAALEQHRNTLLTPVAEEAMRTSLSTFADNPGMTQFVTEHLDVLVRAIRDGIAAAFTDRHGRKFAPEDATARVVRARMTKSKPGPIFSEKSLATIARERDALQARAAQDKIYEDIVSLLAAVIAGPLKPGQLIESIGGAVEIISRQDFPAVWALLKVSLAETLHDEAGNNQPQNWALAIHHAQSVVEDIRIEELVPELWGEACNTMGEAYRERTIGDIRDNIERAIAHYGDALDVITFDTNLAGWAQLRHNLGAAYAVRIEGEKDHNKEKAIALYKEALRVRTIDSLPYEWGVTQNNLANAYASRIRGAKAENDEEAIGRFHQAMHVLTRADHPLLWAMAQNNLGIVYRTRLLGRTKDNVARAVKCFERALEVWTYGAHANRWAMAHANLGNVYLDRAHAKDESSQGLAEQHFGEALKVYTPEQHPHAFGIIQNSLGLLFADGVPTDSADGLGKAIDHFGQALKCFTRDSAPDLWAGVNLNMANACVKAAHSSGDAAQSQHWQKQARRCFVRALSVYRAPLFPRQHVLAARNLGDLHFRQRQWKQAHVAYQSAFTANDLLHEAGATAADRQAELEEVSRALANDAYALAKLQMNPRAVESTERRLARGLGEMLGRREALLDGADAADREAFVSLRARIAGLEVEAWEVGRRATRDYGRIAADIRAARTEMSQLAARIDGYSPGFLPAGVPLVEIGQLVRAMGEPIVYLIGTVAGGVALWVREPGEPEEVTAVWLDDLRLEQLSLATTQMLNLENYLFGIHTLRSDVLKESLRTLWPIMDRHIMSAVAQHLSAEGCQRFTLIAIGLLSVLPIHSVLVDRCVVTCAPSARAVRAAWNSLDARRDGTARLIAIANPESTTRPLPFASLEVKRIAKLFPAATKMLTAGKATRRNVAENAAGKSYFHFSGHAYFDLANPLRSALVLAGGEFIYAEDLLEHRFDLSQVKLFTLSACQTGMRDFRIPDEATGFPSAVIQAGVPAVISTLWPVPDVSTALLLSHFYELHIGAEIDVASALGRAQNWLRRSTAHDLGLKVILENAYLDSRKTDSKELERIRFFERNPQAKPFEHPYYWAGFILHGCGRR